MLAQVEIVQSEGVQPGMTTTVSFAPVVKLNMPFKERAVSRAPVENPRVIFQENCLWFALLVSLLLHWLLSCF